MTVFILFILGPFIERISSLKLIFVVSAKIITLAVIVDLVGAVIIAYSTSIVTDVVGESAAGSKQLDLDAAAIVRPTAAAS